MWGKMSHNVPVAIFIFLRTLQGWIVVHMNDTRKDESPPRHDKSISVRSHLAAVLEYRLAEAPAEPLRSSRHHRRLPRHLHPDLMPRSHPDRCSSNAPVTLACPLVKRSV